jgi:fermentation-respiration switch protein FrsA (DUF1100 family)
MTPLCDTRVPADMIPGVSGLLTLAGVLLVLGVILVLGTVLGMALILLRPTRMTDGRALHILKRLSPTDLGLAFQDVQFKVRDMHTHRPLTVAAWWIPHPHARGQCALLIHGYADAKVGAIAWAPTLHNLGFNILAIDLRAHGQSQGKYSTAGYLERHDVSQVIDQLLAIHPTETCHLVLFGISLGAAVAAAVAVMRNDIRAVVMESPYADFAHATQTHARHIQMPPRPMQSMSLKLAQLISAADFCQVRPVDLIPTVPCPLMIIAGQDDAFVEPQDAAELQAAVRSRPAALGPTVCWSVPAAGHVLGLAVDPERYQQRLGEFLNMAFQYAKIKAPQTCQEPPERATADPAQCGLADL